MKISIHDKLSQKFKYTYESWRKNQLEFNNSL